MKMTKQEFFKKENDKFFFDDPKAIAAYCKTYWPEDTKHILRVADEVCRHYFLFDLKWDMERTYEPVEFEGNIDWGYMPADDKEFIFQFNRHRFFICLGQAYQITGDEKYAKTFTELITQWIDDVKRTKETQETMWRILETGLRGEYWTKAIRYFVDSPYMTDEVIDKIYTSLIEHAEFIVSMHSPYRFISNWGVLENHGLFDIAMSLPNKELSEKYASIALEHLETLMCMGVMEDGVQWEQSPMYHNEVLHCYLDVMILASRNEIEIPDSIKNGVYRMAMADVIWKKPNHCQVMMGDSDDTDIRDLISKAAYMFQDGVLKYAGYERFDFETIWDLGIKAQTEYERIRAKEPDFTSAQLKDSGNTYLRTSWKEDANFLHFHCGTLGAGHGHSDKLHVDLVIGGEDVLVDAGRFHYVAGAERFEFKDPMAHNTITVDQKLFTICKDSWECTKLAQPVKQQFVCKGNYEFVQGGHLGYMDLENGVFVNRKILHIKPDIYILFDEMYTGGEHTYQQYFHFNETGRIELDFDKEQKRVMYQGEEIQTNFYFITPNIELEEYSSRISRHYNLAVSNPCVKVNYKKKGFASLVTVIYGEKKQTLEPIVVTKIPVKSALKQIEYPSSMAEAIKIEVHGKTYIVVCCHQEVNSPTDLVEADECFGFGNVIIFCKEEATKVGTVLNW